MTAAPVLPTPKALRESSVRSAMSIVKAHEDTSQAPSGAACLWTNAALWSMPLLTELVPGTNAPCYRHGAPNGAVSKAAPHSIGNSEEPPRAAQTWALRWNPVGILRQETLRPKGAQ